MATKKVEEVKEEVIETKEVKKDDALDAMKAIIESLQAELKSLKEERTTQKIVVTQDSIAKGERVISDEMKEEIDRQNDKVMFRPMFDGDKYKEDIFVSVNGKGYLIDRKKAYEKGGVMIPRSVYDVIAESEKNIIDLNVVKSGLADTYSKAEERLNG